MCTNIAYTDSSPYNAHHSNSHLAAPTVRVRTIPHSAVFVRVASVLRPFSARQLKKHVRWPVQHRYWPLKPQCVLTAQLRAICKPCPATSLEPSFEVLSSLCTVGVWNTVYMGCGCFGCGGWASSTWHVPEVRERERSREASTPFGDDDGFPQVDDGFQTRQRALQTNTQPHA